MILILEDNPERIARFCRVLGEIAPAMVAMFWNDAHTMIRESMSYLPAAHLISLDHDLEPLPSGEDPGDGLDVAKYLTSQDYRCPVIIHSSNSGRARQMQGEFELARWTCQRVLPIGDDWIETDWRLMTEAALRTG